MSDFSAILRNYRRAQIAATAADATMPPQSIESENYILGAILRDSSCLPAVSEILGENSFYYEHNREIFDACLDLYELGDGIDAASIVQRLEAKGTVRQNDLTFLLDLEDRLLSPGKAAVNAVACAKLVRRYALERKRREIGAKLAEKPDHNVKDELAAIEAEFAKLDGQKQDPWTIYTLKDAYAVRNELLWIIAGLFTLPSLSIVYGAPATLKSFFLAYAAVCISAGIPFLGRETIRAAVMFVDFDNGARRCHERVEALGRAHDLPANLPFYYTSMPSPWLNAQNLRDVESLIQRCLALKVGFICIDNLGLISGVADENGAEMIRVMGNLRLLSERTGAAVVVVHHERKSNGTGGRAGESLRGHSSIEAAIDLALQVEREPHSGAITIKSTKTRDVDVLPFGAEFRYEHKTGTRELSTACFAPCVVEDTLSDYAIEKAIKDVLAKSPLLKQTEMIEKVKAQGIEAGKNRIGPIANRMAERGHIVVSGGHKGAKLYSLT